MKERKPLFPEYIWMFFVGLLLAIIICMRLLPGQAAMYEETAYNNVIFVRITGWTLSFGNEYCDPATAVLNENNSNWSDNDLFKSDLDYNVFMLTNKFGAENLSICLLDDDAVAYAFRYIAALCYKYNINCLYYGNDQDTGTIEGMNFSINPAPWRDNVYTYFSPYYEFYTFSLSSYTLGYYVQHDQYVTPTPSLSPSPSPELQEYNILCPGSSTSTFKRNYMFSFKASGVNDIYVQPIDSTLTSIFTEYNFNSQELKYNAIVSRTGSYGGSWIGAYFGPSLIFYVQVDSYSDLSYYVYNDSIVNSIDTMKQVGTLSSLSSSSNDYVFYQVQELEDGYCLAFVIRDGIYYLFDASDVVSDIWFQTYSYRNTDRYESIYPFRQNSTEYKQSLMLRLDVNGTAVPDPNVTPTPEPTATPTQAPYVEVILPSPTPGPTAPVSFNDSDLPGGASGPGGSISSNDGASSSTADGVYNYWSYVLSQNQALAFIASFFQILPFDLVYALGSLIFILILLAMARLFIHFIE